MSSSLDALEVFLENVLSEYEKAVKKYPKPNPTIAALTEEVGEVTQAALHIYEGKSYDWWRVYDEAVQVAVVAARLALEGDGMYNIVPSEENCK